MINFFEEAQTLFSYAQALRRDFHQHPELGYQEVRTAGVIARELTELGLKIQTGIAETGVVSVIEGKKPGKVVMLRFDMDALPVSEETGADYQSCNAGVMHACGHDGHVAIGLTVAKILQKHRDELCGLVKLVFQPAEEGLNGAERMVLEGVLDNPRPDYALGAHVWNEQPVGCVTVSGGPLMAGSAIFSVKIMGKGGHGALPNQAVDPVVAAAQVITALQSLVSRNVSPLESAVVSVTSVHAGEAFNVIPPQAELKGTLRWFSKSVQNQLLTGFRRIVEGVCAGLDCNCEIDIRDLTAAVINDEHVAEKIQGALQRAMGEVSIIKKYQTMGSEDMAFFLNEIPGCYIFVGSKNDLKGLNYGHHHPKFDFDESALTNAVAVLSLATFELLNNEQEKSSTACGCDQRLS